MIGTCRFCGQLREVNAPDVGLANEKASRTCDCAGSEHYARKMATTEAMETICENYDLTDEQVTVLQAIALAVDDGVVVKGQPHHGRTEGHGGQQAQRQHLCEDRSKRGRKPGDHPGWREIRRRPWKKLRS